MTGQPTIDRDVVRPIVSSVRALGGDVESLLEQSSLSKDWFDSASDTLHEAPVWEFLERSARSLDRRRIGWQAGATLQIRDLGPFGRQLEQSLTLYHCLEEYVRRVNCYSSHARFWLDYSSDGSWFCRRGIDLIDVGREYAEQFALQLMIRLVQLAAGPDWFPAYIRVQAQTVSPDGECGDFDSTEVECLQPVTAVWIPHALNSKVIPRENDDPITQFVRESVSIEKEHVFCSLEITAERLGFSKRTLQRELSKNGLDWSRLLDQIRLQRAIELLRSTDMKLVEIGYEVGYTDPANFGRAFRRWTGVTPKTYRRLWFACETYAQS